MKYPIFAVFVGWAVVVLSVLFALGRIDLGTYLHPILAFFTGPIPTVAYAIATLALLAVAGWSAAARGGRR